MKWIALAGANIPMGEKQEEYETVMIRVDREAYDFKGEVGVRETSFMRFGLELNMDELQQLARGVPLVVSIMGTRFAPISITVGDPSPPPEAPTDG